MDLLALGTELTALTEEELAARAYAVSPEQRTLMQAALEAVVARDKARYWLYDPVGWINTHVDFSQASSGDGLAPYQEHALTTLVDDGRLAVRSPNGAGKTSTAALAVLWFALTRDAAGIDWKIPTTATVYRQLREFLWAEIGQWADRLRWSLLGRAPFGRLELQATSLRLANGSGWAMSSTNPAAIEGAHATHILYVFDEAKGIAVPVWDAAEGAFAGAGGDTAAEAWALAISTPAGRSGRFYDLHARKRGGWSTQHITRAEAIAAGRMSAEWAATQVADFGAESAFVRQRVDGEFADDLSNQVIPLEWIEQANERWHEVGEERRTSLSTILSDVGLDCAREGRDRNSLARFTDDVCLWVDYLGSGHGPAVAASALAALGSQAGRVMWMIDAEGVGASVYDHLAASDVVAGKLHAFVAGAKTTRRDITGQLRFYNLRSAAWFSLADRLNPNRPHYGAPTLALPPLPDLTGDLSTPTWELRDGKVLVEPKKEIRKRLGRSTDMGDAVVQGAWAQSVAVGRVSTTEARLSQPERPPSDDDEFAFNPMTTSF